MADKKSILVGLLITIIIVGIFGYYIASREKRRIDRIIEIEMQMEQLVRELEVSVWETANAVFYYLVEPSKTAAEEYNKQLGDVKNFTAKYKDLIVSEEEKEMVAKFERVWADSVSRSRRLIELRDELAEVAVATWDAVHQIDAIIDYKIQPAFVQGIPDLVEKEKAVREVEAGIWEAISATNQYLNNRSHRAQRELLTQLEDVNEFWEKFQKLNRISAKEPHIREFENLWIDAVVRMKKCISITNELKDKELAFWESIYAVDDIVDFEIQTHLDKRIKKVTK